MTRLGLVGDPRQPDARTDRQEPDDERDIRTSLSNLAGTLSAHGDVLLSADLALDLVLNRIAEQARLATNTTGAAIALRRGDEMVCRATTGANAPGLGVRLNTESGLSGACVQTRQVQSCDDTENDLRVDGIACRQLGVRSILIVPVMKEQELLGVLEVFSPHPQAFGDRDVQTLQALSQRAVDSITRSVEAVSPRPASLPAETVVAVATPVKTRRRDPWTVTLTFVVISLAVFLGWLLGHDDWQRTIRRMKTKSASVEKRVNSQAAPASASASPLNDLPGAPVSTAPAKSAPSAASSGALVVYQNGKVIFRAKPQSGRESNPDESSQPGNVPELTPTELPPQIAERYLMQRIEPVYPETARHQHIEGQVLLQATVGTNGIVEELKVISGDPQLATAAADAVGQWRFHPFLKSGKPVEFATKITVDFRLP